MTVMSEKTTFTDSLAKWSVPILLAVLGFMGAQMLGKVENLGHDVSTISVQQASTQATLSATQSILTDFKADAEVSRQDVKEKLTQADTRTKEKLDSLTAWIATLSTRIDRMNKLGD